MENPQGGNKKSKSSKKSKSDPALVISKTEESMIDGDPFAPGDGTLSMTGVSLTAFNPIKPNGEDKPLEFVLSSAGDDEPDLKFDTDLSSIGLLINGQTIVLSGAAANGTERYRYHRQLDTSEPIGWFSDDSKTFFVDTELVDGRNLISLKAYDNVGRPIYLQKVIWAGGHALTVEIYDRDGNQVSDQTEFKVIATLSDDHNVQQVKTTTTGKVEFDNCPRRTILLSAQTTKDGSSIGFGGTTDVDSTYIIRTTSFNEASSIDNNSFESGTVDGWQTPEDESSFEIVTHSENVGPGTGSIAVRDRRVLSPTGDNDLLLRTVGEGPTYISRTFVAKPGVTSVALRYRFQTEEVPGGYFGSEFNDFFSVAVRTLTGGDMAYESNNMNQLGLHAFDSAGSTAWRQKVLPISNDQDTVQVDVEVANVADDLYDSVVFVDFVQESTASDLRVTPEISWNSIIGGIDLKYTVSSGGALVADQPIVISWTYGDSQVGGEIYQHVVEKGTGAGSYGPINLDASVLQKIDPKAKQIVASGTGGVATLDDVVINFRSYADATVVSCGMMRLMKESLRAAGQAKADISSTIRSPKDQARAMFNNLVKQEKSIEQNIQDQLNEYGTSGDKVVNLFASLVKNKSRQQISSDAESIKSQMEAKIIELDPYTVSHHCGDPLKLSVIDVPTSVFGSNMQLFESYARSRATNFLNEYRTNYCFHIELTVEPDDCQQSLETPKFLERVMIHLRSVEPKPSQLCAISFLEANIPAEVHRSFSCDYKNLEIGNSACSSNLSLKDAVELYDPSRLENQVMALDNLQAEMEKDLEVWELTKEYWYRQLICEEPEFLERVMIHLKTVEQLSFQLCSLKSLESYIPATAYKKFSCSYQGVSQSDPSCMSNLPLLKAAQIYDEFREPLQVDALLTLEQEMKTQPNIWDKFVAYWRNQEECPLDDSNNESDNDVDNDPPITYGPCSAGIPGDMKTGTCMSWGDCKQGVAIPSTEGCSKAPDDVYCCIPFEGASYLPPKTIFPPNSKQVTTLYDKLEARCVTQTDCTGAIFHDPCIYDTVGCVDGTKEAFNCQSTDQICLDNLNWSCPTNEKACIDETEAVWSVDVPGITLSKDIYNTMFPAIKNTPRGDAFYPYLNHAIVQVALNSDNAKQRCYKVAAFVAHHKVETDGQMHFTERISARKTDYVYGKWRGRGAMHLTGTWTWNHYETYATKLKNDISSYPERVAFPFLGYLTGVLYLLQQRNPDPCITYAGSDDKNSFQMLTQCIVGSFAEDKSHFSNRWSNFNELAGLLGCEQL